MADRVSPSNGASSIPVFEALLPQGTANGEGEGEGEDEGEGGHLHSIEEAEHEAEVTSTTGAELREAEERLDNQSDLTDLDTMGPFLEPTASAMRLLDTNKSLSFGGVSEYPSSPSVADFFTSASAPYGSFSLCQRKFRDPHDGQAFYRRCCLDLRGKEPGIQKFSPEDIPHRPEQEDFKTHAAAYFKCSEDDIHVLQLLNEPAPAVIIKDTAQHLAVIVNFVNNNEHEGKTCLLVGRDVSLSSGLGMCKQWVEKTLKHPPSCQVCLLQNGQRLDSPYPFNDLQDFQELQLTRVETLTLKFVCRRSPCSEQVFYIDCRSTDYVQEVKEKFLQVFQENQLGDHCTVTDSHNVWFTNGDTIAPSDKLLTTVLYPKEDQFSLEARQSEDTFYVHFQPPDSVLVKLNFRSDSRKHFKSESVILLSPTTTTAHTLRREVSKVVHKDPLSFKMFISDKKIEQDTVLELLLRNPPCTVDVEQRPQIELHVQLHEPRYSAPWPVLMHRYELVQRLKEHVCSVLGMPFHCVDLHHKDARLDESLDLRGSRLRTGDTVKALVLPNRIRVRVRLMGCDHWEEVVVDDVNVTTVGHLIAYVCAPHKDSPFRQTPGHDGGARTTEQESPPFSGVITFKALHRRKVLAHGATLREAGVAMNSRVLVQRQKSFCFTSSCFGRVPIYVCCSEDDYRPAERVMVMCDGGRIYWANPRGEEADEVPSVQQQPWPHDQLPTPSGLQACSGPLSHQFPPYGTGSTDSTESTPQTPPSPAPWPYVCSTCKSESMPVFPSSSPVQGKMSRSQSSNLRDRRTGQAEGPTTSSSSLRHSTPVHDGRNDQEELASSLHSMDLCDGDPSDAGSTLPSSTRQDGYLSDPVASRRTHRLQPNLKVKLSPVKVLPQNMDIGQQRNGNGSRPVRQQFRPGGGGGGGGSSTARSLSPLVQEHSGHFLSPNKSHHGNGGSGFRFSTSLPLTPRARGDQSLSDVDRTSQKAVTRSYTVQQSLEEKKGELVTTTQVQTTHTIPKEMLKQSGLVPGLISPFPFGPPSATSQLALPGAQGAPAEECDFPRGDITFAYVKKSTIMLIANNLGTEGMNILMDLLPRNIVTEIEERFPREAARRYSEGLSRWLQLKGSKATVTDLKEVLNRYGRTDLVEEVDKNEAKERGYETAP